MSTIPCEFPRNQNETLLDFIDRLIDSIFKLFELILLPKQIVNDIVEHESVDSIFEIMEIPKTEAQRKKTIFNASGTTNDVNITSIQDLTRHTLMRNASIETLHSMPKFEDKENVTSSDSLIKEVSVEIGSSTFSNNPEGPNRMRSFTHTLQKNRKRHSFSIGPHINTDLKNNVSERPKSSITDYKNEIRIKNSPIDYTKRISTRPVAFQPSSSNSKASLIPMYDGSESFKVMSIETVNKTIADDEDQEIEIKTIYNPPISNNKSEEEPLHNIEDSNEKLDLKSKIAGLRYI